MSSKIAKDNQIWRLEQQTNAYMQTTASRWSEMDGRKDGKNKQKEWDYLWRRQYYSCIRHTLLMNDSWKTTPCWVQDIEFWWVLF